MARLIGFALLLGSFGAIACGAPVRDQWTVTIGTDAQLPQFADRLLVEIVNASGDLVCKACRRTFPVSQSSFPFSFGIARTDPPPIVRARLYRADRVASDGTPSPTSSIDGADSSPRPR